MWHQQNMTRRESRGSAASVAADSLGALAAAAPVAADDDAAAAPSTCSSSSNSTQLRSKKVQHYSTSGCSSCSSPDSSGSDWEGPRRRDRRQPKLARRRGAAQATAAAAAAPSLSRHKAPPAADAAVKPDGAAAAAVDDPNRKQRRPGAGTDSNSMSSSGVSAAAAAADADSSATAGDSTSRAGKEQLQEHEQLLPLQHLQRRKYQKCGRQKEEEHQQEVQRQPDSTPSSCRVLRSTSKRKAAPALTATAAALVAGVKASTTCTASPVLKATGIPEAAPAGCGTAMERHFQHSAAADRNYNSEAEGPLTAKSAVCLPTFAASGTAAARVAAAAGAAAAKASSAAAGSGEAAHPARQQRGLPATPDELEATATDAAVADGVAAAANEKTAQAETDHSCSTVSTPGTAEAAAVGCCSSESVCLERGQQQPQPASPIEFQQRKQLQQQQKCRHRSCGVFEARNLRSSCLPAPHRNHPAAATAAAFEADDEDSPVAAGVDTGKTLQKHRQHLRETDASAVPLEFAPHVLQLFKESLLALLPQEQHQQQERKRTRSLSLVAFAPSEAHGSSSSYHTPSKCSQEICGRKGRMLQSVAAATATAVAALLQAEFKTDSASSPKAAAAAAIARHLSWNTKRRSFAARISGVQQPVWFAAKRRGVSQALQAAAQVLIKNLHRRNATHGAGAAAPEATTESEAVDAHRAAAEDAAQASEET